MTETNIRKILVVVSAILGYSCLAAFVILSFPENFWSRYLLLLGSFLFFGMSHNTERHPPDWRL